MTELIFEKKSNNKNLLHDIKMELYQMSGIDQDNFRFLLVYEHSMKQYGSPNFQHKNFVAILSFEKTQLYAQIHKGHIALESGEHDPDAARRYSPSGGDIVLYFDKTTIPSQWNLSI